MDRSLGHTTRVVGISSCSCRAGLVDEVRGQITIRDRAELAAACCECYRLMRDEQYRLLGY